MSQEIRLNVESVGEKEEPKFSEWEIADACRTIIRAEEIKQDKELMALITPKLKQQVQAAANAAKILYGEGEKNEG